MREVPRGTARLPWKKVLSRLVKASGAATYFYILLASLALAAIAYLVIHYYFFGSVI
jgi:hypothetical protein